MYFVQELMRKETLSNVLVTRHHVPPTVRASIIDLKVVEMHL
jgi:hypothetical protein